MPSERKIKTGTIMVWAIVLLAILIGLGRGYLLYQSKNFKAPTTNATQ